MDNLNLILTSTLIAGIVSSIVSFLISIQLKKVDFKHEYYKEILKKRLTSYQYIEAQLALLKTVVLDEKDHKPYHIIFSYGEDKLIEYQKNMVMAMGYSFWIDEDTVQSIEKLNELFYGVNLKVNGKSNNEIIEIAKTQYENISELRFQLENSAKRGLYNLHDIKKASKIKKSNTKRIISKLNVW